LLLAAGRAGAKRRRVTVVRNFPESFQHSTGTAVHLDPSRILLVFSRPPARRGLEATLAEHGLVLEATEEGAPDVLGDVINQTETHYWARTAAGEPVEDDTLGALEDALGQRFGFISPVYRAQGVPGRSSCFSPLANVVIIKPPVRAQGEPIRLDQAAERLGLREIPEKSRYLGGYRYFVVADPAASTCSESGNG
jgi:hypothetical protein